MTVRASYYEDGTHSILHYAPKCTRCGMWDSSLEETNPENETGLHDTPEDCIRLLQDRFLGSRDQTLYWVRETMRLGKTIHRLQNRLCSRKKQSKARARAIRKFRTP